eukprot:6181986-Pleurochrysis_carterae.AAC.2
MGEAIVATVDRLEHARLSWRSRGARGSTRPRRAGAHPVGRPRRSPSAAFASRSKRRATPGRGATSDGALRKTSGRSRRRAPARSLERKDGPSRALRHSIRRDRPPWPACGYESQVTRARQRRHSLCLFPKRASGWRGAGGAPWVDGCVRSSHRAPDGSACCRLHPRVPRCSVCLA